MMPFLRTRWGATVVALYTLFALFTLWVLQQPDAESRVVHWVDFGLGTAAILIFLTGVLHLTQSASGRLRKAWLLLAARQTTLETVRWSLDRQLRRDTRWARC